MELKSTSQIKHTLSSLSLLITSIQSPPIARPGGALSPPSAIAAAALLFTAVQRFLCCHCRCLGVIHCHHSCCPSRPSQHSRRYISTAFLSRSKIRLHFPPVRTQRCCCHGAALLFAPNAGTAALLPPSAGLSSLYVIPRSRTESHHRHLLFFQPRLPSQSIPSRHRRELPEPRQPPTEVAAVRLAATATRLLLSASREAAVR